MNNMNEKVIHSGFKAKTLALCAAISVAAMALACAYPDSQQAVSTVAGSLNLLGGAAIGGRAWQQNSYVKGPRTLGRSGDDPPPISRKTP